MVLKKTYKCSTEVVLKRFVGKCSGSTSASVWCQLTAEEAEAGLVAVDVHAAWWWLEERRRVVSRVVKTAAVCQSVCSSSLTVDCQRS